jgi:acetyl esterase/lipase
MRMKNGRKALVRLVQTALVIALLATAVLPVTGCSSSALLGTVQKDLVYSTAGNTSLRMDIYYPYKADGLIPVILDVHGGAWIMGDKKEAAGSEDVAALRDAGFAIAAIDYRLSPEYKFPAMIEDVKCAVRFLRANAPGYELDPDRVGAMGYSAGGHLVSLLGVTDRIPGWDETQYADYSSRVQAVADLYGPADLPKLFSLFSFLNPGTILGADNPDDPMLIEASPVTWASPDDPPFLIIQGDRDFIVPPSQSQELYDTLVAAGVDAQLVIVKNGGHGLEDKPTLQPSRQEITEMLVRFFEEHLS